jgi:putative glycosyltransferase
MKLSIVTTMYYSSPYLEEFHRRIVAAARPITDDYEFVLVNDGSPDNSLEVALSLRKQDPRICVVDLSRNFGHHRAMMIGLNHTKGDMVFLLDCDLEEPPEALPILYQKLKEDSADVVFGVQTKRHDPILKSLFAIVYYRLLGWIADEKIPANLLTARLMSRRYVDALVRHQERVFNIEGLWQRTGFKQVAIPVDKLDYKGASTYNFRRQLALAVTSILSTSNKPLILIGMLGIFITLPAALGIIILVIRYFLLGQGVEGWASLIVSLWFLGGLIISMLGIIALYLAVIFEEVKQRPYSIVAQLYEAQ